MNTFRKALLVAVPALFLLNGALAQNAHTGKALVHYQHGEYAKAITNYERAVEKGPLDPGSERNLADSYYQLRALDKALPLYERIAERSDVTAMELYNYSETLRSDQRYMEADHWLAAYGRSMPQDSRVSKKSGSFARLPLLRTITAMDGDLYLLSSNTPHSDISPWITGDKLVFASPRKEEMLGEREDASAQVGYLDLYQGDIGEDGSIKQVRTYMPALNTRYNESNVTISADGTELYFNRNNPKGKSVKAGKGLEVSNLMIYFCRQENGVWSKEQPFAFNDPAYSTGHPALSKDGKRLYLVSDMPGGHGGTDLYVCHRRPDGSWGSPINLGAKVNTEGNELFPFIHGNNLLFFASDGHLGLGGLDLFMAQVINDKGVLVQNVGQPINSPHDDMGLVLGHDGRSGFVSSDRPGGVGGDDIYRFRLRAAPKLEQIVFGRVVDDVDRLPLRNITVILRDRNDRELARAKTDDKGNYALSFVRDPEIDSYDEPEDWSPFSVFAELVGLEPKMLPVDDQKLAEQGMDDVDIELRAIANLMMTGLVRDKGMNGTIADAQLFLVDKITGDTLARGRTDAQGVVSFEVGDVKYLQQLRYKLVLNRPGYKTAEYDLDMLVENFLAVDLNRHADLTMESMVEGISAIHFDLNQADVRTDALATLELVHQRMAAQQDMIIVLEAHTDARGSSAYNNKLSAQRAQAVAEKLVRLGVARDRIKVEALGMTKPLVPCLDEAGNCDEEIHAENRRVEFNMVTKETHSTLVERVHGVGKTK